MNRARIIPLDVWFHVAEQIPREHLNNLLSVNKAFFYTALAVRYHTVCIKCWDLETFMLLERLQ
jgi:hypothetical protein